MGLNVTPSGSGGTNEGKLLLGLEGSAFIPIVICGVLSTGGLALAASNNWGILGFAVAIAPTPLCFAYLLIFVAGKGPHYQRDLWHSFFMRGVFFRFPMKVHRLDHLFPRVIALHRDSLAKLSRMGR